MSRNSVTIAAGIKLAIFTIVSILMTGLLVVVMGNVGFGASDRFKAVFTDASTLAKGDDVRVAGVSVGEVKSVEHYERGDALVEFRVEEGVQLTTASRAEIRFLNLVGDRYLALVQGEASKAASLLEAGSTIPIKNTKPSLDLTTLFNGFQPLFQALQPEQVNKLSLNLVQVLQGEGGTIQSLLKNTASFTNTLADRDQLIGEVVTNLSETLATVDNHQAELNTLVTELKGWLTKLAKDRQVIGSSLNNISDLAETLASLVSEGRPLLTKDLKELEGLMSLLSEKESEALLVQTLDRLPESMTDQTRTGTYGSWYNYYLCGASVEIQLPSDLTELLPGLDLSLLDQLFEQIGQIEYRSTEERCK